MMMEPTALRDRLTNEAYFGTEPDDVTGRMECAYNALIKVEPIYNRFTKAVAKGQAEGFTIEEQLKSTFLVLYGDIMFDMDKCVCHRCTKTSAYR